MWDIFLYLSWAIVKSSRQAWEKYVPKNCICSVLIILRKSWARFSAIFLSLGAPCHGIYPIGNYGDISSICGFRQDSEAASLVWALQRQHLCCSYFAQIHPPVLQGKCSCPASAIPLKTTGQDLSFSQAGLSTWGEWRMAGQTLAAARGCCHTRPESAAHPALPHQQGHVPQSCSNGHVKSRIARLYLTPLLQTYIFIWQSLHLWIITPINQYWKQWFNLRCESLSSQALKAATSYLEVAAAATNTAEERCCRLRDEILLRKALVLWCAIRNGMPALQSPLVAWAVHLMICPPHRAEVAEGCVFFQRLFWEQREMPLCSFHLL